MWRILTDTTYQFVILFPQEIKPGMVELMKPKYTLKQSEIQHGDIICFQAEISDEKARELESKGLFSDPVQFYEFLQNRVTVTFRPKFNDTGANQPEFSLVLNKKQTYDSVGYHLFNDSVVRMFLIRFSQMAAEVGERLKHEPMKLRFTTTHTANSKAKYVAKRGLNQPIATIIPSSSIASYKAVILYEKLDVSIIDLETKRNLKVTWTSLHNEERVTYPFLLSKTDTVGDLIDELSKRVQLTPAGTGKLRVLKMAKDGETREELATAERIENIPDPVELFAEEVPPEEPVQ